MPKLHTRSSQPCLRCGLHASSAQDVPSIPPEAAHPFILVASKSIRATPLYFKRTSAAASEHMCVPIFEQRRQHDIVAMYAVRPLELRKLIGAYGGVAMVHHVWDQDGSCWSEVCSQAKDSTEHRQDARVRIIHLGQGRRTHVCAGCIFELMSESCTQSASSVTEARREARR